MADEGQYGLLLCRLLGRALPVACPLSSAGSPCWGLVGLSQCVSVRSRGLPLSRAMADLLYCWRHHKEMGLSRLFTGAWAAQPAGCGNSSIRNLPTTDLCPGLLLLQKWNTRVGRDRM